MSELSVIILTCEKYKSKTWNEFVYFWKPLKYKTYWCSEKTHPEGFEFISTQTSVFSTGLINVLNAVNTEYILLMFCDYWQFKTIKESDIDAIVKIMDENNIKMCNICHDYGQDVYCADIFGLKQYKELRLIFNYQAAIWDRQTLIQCVYPGEDPWNSEINGSQKFKSLGIKAYNYPLRWYVNAYDKGRLSNEGEFMKKQML